MDAYPRHCTDRGLIRVGAPRLLRHEKSTWRRRLGHTKTDRPQAAVPDTGADFADGGMKPALIVDAEHDARLLDRFERRSGACHGQRKRLLHVDVLARSCRAFDVFLVLAVRRGIDDRVDAAVLEYAVEIVAQLDRALFAEIFRLRAGARVAGNEGDLIAFALHGVDAVSYTHLTLPTNREV